MTTKIIGIAVVEHAGNYLVGVRQADQVLAGHAEFPGGKCEPGESPQDCAVRECREETGLAVVAERLLERTTFTYPHGDVELHFWLCRPEPGEPLADSHQGFVWAPAQKLCALNFPAANESVVRQLSQAIAGTGVARGRVRLSRPGRQQARLSLRLRILPALRRRWPWPDRG